MTVNIVRKQVFVTYASTGTKRERTLIQNVLQILDSLDVELVDRLDSADAMVIIRSGVSESAAFDAAYNVFAGPRVPMFLASWKHAHSQAAVWRDLDRVCRTEYALFDRPDELRRPLAAFLEHVAGESRRRDRRMMRMMEHLVA